MYCISRYYVAEGVRIYNQDTWKMVTAGSGKELVETYIREIVSCSFTCHYDFFIITSGIP